MAPRRIIFTHGGGRFANQLVNFGHLIAFCEEHRGAFVVGNVAFWPYASLMAQVAPESTYPFDASAGRTLHRVYTELKRSGKRGEGKLGKGVARFWHRYGALMPQAQSVLVGDTMKGRLPGKRIDQLDLNAEDALRLLQRKRTTVLGGWGVRSWPLFERHQGIIREALAIHPRFTTIAEAFINDLRQRYDYLIGVFIRQTDYRQHQDGRYFFETPQYVRWMHEAADVFADRGRVGFVVASDEEQDPALFEGVSAHFTSGIKGAAGHYMESFAELMQCDLILSPVSTFSAWAAFLGEVPLLPLLNINDPLTATSVMPNPLVALMPVVHRAEQQQPAASS